MAPRVENSHCLLGREVTAEAWRNSLWAQICTSVIVLSLTASSQKEELWHCTLTVTAVSLDRHTSSSRCSQTTVWPLQTERSTANQIVSHRSWNSINNLVWLKVARRLSCSVRFHNQDTQSWNSEKLRCSMHWGFHYLRGQSMRDSLRLESNLSWDRMENKDGGQSSELGLEPGACGCSTWSWNTWARQAGDEQHNKERWQ